MNKTLKFASVLVFLAIAYAAGTTYKLVINGKSVSGQAIVVNGQTYVLLAALKAAGVQIGLAAGTPSLTLPEASSAGNVNASQTAVNPLNALEGCIGQTLLGCGASR